MPLPFFRPKRDRSAPGKGLESIRSLFSKFQRIQKLNTRALERMARMEQALGGEYIFDRAFLESSVRELGTLTYQVVYSLNAMSRDRYVELFERYQTIKFTLDDILDGGLGPFAGSLTLPYSVLGWEMEPLAGTVNVFLAEARLRLDLAAPDGFAVTTGGSSLFMETNGIADAWRQGVFEPLQRTLEEAIIPEALDHAIRKELEALCARNPGINRLSVRVCDTGAPGMIQTGPEVSRETSVEGLISACTRAMTEHLAKAAGLRPAGPAPFALAIHEAWPARVRGSIKPLASTMPVGGLFLITAAPVNSPGKIERYFLRRVHPFDLVQSDAAVSCPVCESPVPDSEAFARTSKGLYRGSSILDRASLRALAQSAARIEQLLGCSRELHWAVGSTERPIFLDIRPLGESDQEDAGACVVGEALKDARVLLHGGATVQAGISAGRAVHVREDADMSSFPHGAVAVVEAAGPHLSPVLRRASALVAELGTAISHLATLARELRIPAVFGASGALERIPDGCEVTVDAGERTVYEGVVESLLVCRECSSDLYPGDPEYASLRRLLRWIMPLHLIDPESEDFHAGNCRTYHDILHFAHERSVEELLHLQDRGGAVADFHTRKLDLEVPMDLFVIDLGGGILDHAEGRPLGPRDVRSRPFRAFLRGLDRREMWNDSPGSIRLRDVLSGMDRTFEAMTSPSGPAAMNHAIVAENFMNLGLRLGYHFSVVDACLCSDMNRNHVYFRFVGGFADERRRRLRGELIRTLLEEMRFKVIMEGDLVVGKLKIAPEGEVAAVLTTLGELTGFTRQLDLSMTSEEKVSRLAEIFRRQSLGRSLSGNREEDVDA